MSEFITVAKVGDVPAGRRKSFFPGGHPVAIFFVEGRYYALKNECPHMGAPLSTGDICDGLVICDRHLWAFRLADGICPDAPQLVATTYPLRIVNDEIQVCLEREVEPGLQGNGNAGQEPRERG